MSALNLKIFKTHKRMIFKVKAPKLCFFSGTNSFGSIFPPLALFLSLPEPESWMNAWVPMFKWCCFWRTSRGKSLPIFISTNTPVDLKQSQFVLKVLFGLFPFANTCFKSVVDMSYSTSPFFLFTNTSYKELVRTLFSDHISRWVPRPTTPTGCCYIWSVNRHIWDCPWCHWTIGEFQTRKQWNPVCRTCLMNTSLVVGSECDSNPDSVVILPRLLLEWT